MTINREYATLDHKNEVLVLDVQDDGQTMMFFSEDNDLFQIAPTLATALDFCKSEGYPFSIR